LIILVDNNWSDDCYFLTAVETQYVLRSDNRLDMEQICLQPCGQAYGLSDFMFQFKRLSSGFEE